MFPYVFLLSLPVSAFSPDPDLHIGIEPSRLLHFTPQKQSRLRGASSWQGFTASAGKGWQVRFDEFTGQPHSAWGKGIALGATGTAEEAVAAAAGFFSGHDAVFGGKASILSGGRASQNTELDAWYVHFDQLVEVEGGVDDIGGSYTHVSHAEVWRGGLDAKFRDGLLTQFSSRLQPDLGIWRSSLTSSQATAVARENGPAPLSLHSKASADLVLLPSPRNGQEHRLCWMVRSRTESPVGHWVSFVSADTGELLHVYNEVRFLEGSLLGENDGRTVDGDFTLSPLRRLKIFTEEDSLYTDEEGVYSSEHGVSQESQLRGRRTRVFNASGDELGFEILGGEQILSTDDEEIQSQIDQYVYQNQIYDWADLYAPHVVESWPRSDVNVNLDDVCNAYFDGELNFYRAGEGCNNTGRIADVSYHEWGHGFHYYNLLSGDYDGSMSEGISDAVAFFQTGDYRISPNFGTNGSAIREVSSDRVYPDDVVNEVHMDGLIFAGAIWDLWEILEDRYPEDEAYDVLVGLFVQALRSGPDIPSSYDAFIFADDDNADLADGTPHECEIIDAFGRHGLGPSGGRGFFDLGHEPLATQEASEGSYPLSAELFRYAENCIDSDIIGVDVAYTADGGETWLTEEAELSDDLITGSIPVQPAGSVVQYYIEIQDSEGRIVRSPEGGPINPFSFYVGELEELYCNDFETDDGGYTHELLEGQQQEGADDWMWGMPAGLGGDPSAAYSGDYVWGNDLGGDLNGESYNGEYQNDKFNRMTSVGIDPSGYDQVLLTYRRWLNVEDGYYDQARIRANGETIWSNHSTRYEVGDEHHEDLQWAPHSLLIDSSGTDELLLSWEIQSDAGLSMGGWNIDDVCVYGVVLPEIDTGEDLQKESGCSCSSASTPGGTWLVSVLFLAIGTLRRRR
jgi:MYXO-CTERM domain-containing protein